MQIGRRRVYGYCFVTIHASFLSLSCITKKPNLGAVQGHLKIDSTIADTTPPLHAFSRHFKTLDQNFRNTAAEVDTYDVGSCQSCHRCHQFSPP